MVAREAGVSASTVSRIINGTVNVSDELKQAVEAAIEKFDFRPNAAARGLALGKTLTIGVVAQAIDSPFYGEGLRGIEASLRKRGYAPLFMSGNWHEEDEDRCMRELIARGVDGIIVFAGRLSDAKLRRYANEVSVVVTGRQLRAKGLSSLQIDDRQGAMLAVRHLLELGHRRIAFINGSETIRTRSSASGATARRWKKPASNSIRSWSRWATGTKMAACSQPSSCWTRRPTSPRCSV